LIVSLTTPAVFAMHCTVFVAVAPCLSAAQRCDDSGESCGASARGLGCDVCQGSRRWSAGVLRGGPGAVLPRIPAAAHRAAARAQHRHRLLQSGTFFSAGKCCPHSDAHKQLLRYVSCVDSAPEHHLKADAQRVYINEVPGRCAISHKGVLPAGDVAPGRGPPLCGRAVLRLPAGVRPPARPPPGDPPNSSMRPCRPSRDVSLVAISPLLHRHQPSCVSN
jgi:hypothetical protein